MKAGRITARQLDELRNPTLEDVLAFVSGGKYGRFFRQTPRKTKDGGLEYLTREGGRAYCRLVTLLYSVARLAEGALPKAGCSIEDIVTELDRICDSST